jgi:hypothetical protein
VRILRSMTLIVTCLSPHYVLQVSDRRLSLGGKAIERAASKAVVFNNALIFGYTGIAEIAGKPTDAWLADVLSQHLDSVPRAIEALTQAVQVPTDLQRYQHTFVACGFHHPDDKWLPMAITISNMQDGFGLQSGALTGWTTVGRTPRPHETNDVKVLIAGYIKGITKERLAGIEATIKRRALVDPNYAAATLVGLVRQASGRFPGVIGKDVLVSCLPRAAVGTPETIVTVSEPNLKQMSIASRLQDDTADLHYVPHVLTRSVWMQNVTVRGLKYLVAESGPPPD